MLATLKMMREIYGGADGYIRTMCGLSETDLVLIRKHLVED